MPAKVEPPKIVPIWHFSAEILTVLTILTLSLPYAQMKSIRRPRLQVNCALVGNSVRIVRTVRVGRRAAIVKRRANQDRAILPGRAESPMLQMR